MEYEIVVDGGADLLRGTPADTMRVPLNIIIGDKEYTYPGTITKDDVSKHIRELKPGMVKTSQPSPKQILSALDGLEGDVLYITLSSRLSGTYNAATVAANLLRKKGINLHVFDSLLASICVGILAKEAHRLRDQGSSLDDVISTLERLRGAAHIFFAVPTLDYLVAGGRLDPFKAALAKIVGVRPILCARDGRIDLETTVRKDKIWAKIAALADSSSVILAYSPGGKDTEALEEHLRYRDIKIDEKVLFSPIVTAHVGPGAAGFAFVKKDV